MIEDLIDYIQDQRDHIEESLNTMKPIEQVKMYGYLQALDDVENFINDSDY